MMILSRDYTSVRLAALSDDLIERWAYEYPTIQAYTPSNTSYINMIRGIAAEFAKTLPGKEDLVTEWFLAYLNQSNRDTLYDSVAQFSDLAVWYFTHVKDEKFRKLVREHSTVTGQHLNPKNLLDFSARDMEYIKHDYEIMEEAGRVNNLPDKLPDGADLFYDNGQYKIVEVTGSEAACRLGMGTKWCTREEPFASNYVIQNPLYVIYRDNQKTAQFYLGSPVAGVNVVELKNLKNNAMKPDDGMRAALEGSGLMDKVLEKAGRGEFGEERFRDFTGSKASPYLEQACSKKPWLAYFYARNILRGRFPEGEPAIARDGEVSLVYTSTVVGGRFPEGEPAILKPGYRDLYVQVLKEENDLDGLAAFQAEYPWEGGE